MYKRKILAWTVPMTLLLTPGTSYAQTEADSTFIGDIQSIENFFEMSLDDLLKLEITTASNSSESVADAPATTIVITKDQIRMAGYNDILEILMDLPGMEIVTPYGDTYFKNYWRGYRNTIGDPYLFMVDGVIFNSLYFNHTTVLATVPLSNIERIEVVYGPASSVYGANAFMGVINVITKKERKEDGSEFHSRLSGSTNGYHIADMSAFHQNEKLRISLTGRIESGNLNQKVNGNDFYWLQDKWYDDRKLWGAFVDNKTVAGGGFSSPIRNKGVDMRLYYGDIELGVRYYENATGYGAGYPGDRIQSQSMWVLPEYSGYLRYNKIINEKVASRTLFRYRRYAVDGQSQYIEGYNVRNKTTDSLEIGGIDIAPQESVRIVDYSYWQSQNTSWSMYQDFDIQINPMFSINTGLKYEIKNLQKAYDINWGMALFPDLITPSTLPDMIPEPPSKTLRNENRIIWQDVGAYIQGRYHLGEKTIANLGVRIDENSAYGTVATLRAGLVQKMGKFTAKLLYGDGFQEPAPRTLYGGWRGSGSDPSLEPERSRTIEANFNYTTTTISNLLSVYWINNQNTIISFTGGAKNAGSRQVMGLDYHFRKNFDIFKQFTVWAYYSWIIHEEEQKFDSQGNKTNKDIIGDLAHHRIQFGANALLTDKFNVSLKGRYVSKRDNVLTNPIRQTEGFLVMDMNLNYKDLIFKGLSANIKVMNVLDTKYYHPGIRDANSGMEGGTWVGNSFEGSKGWYNSLIPQPRRFVMLGLTLDI